MNGLEFQEEVATFLDVDASRRGLADFKAAQTKAALSDLARYIEDYNTGQLTYEDDEITPFDTEVAEAVSEFIKSRITRNVDRDLSLSQTHWATYLNLRRRLFLRMGDERRPELRPFIGKVFTATMNLRLGKMPMPIIANVWLTVKSYRGYPDCAAVFQLQRGEGIEILDADTSKIRVTFSEEQTALLCFREEYYFDVQVEDEHNPIFPLSGTVRPRYPVTHVFKQTIMTFEGEPLLTFEGVPISVY